MNTVEVEYAVVQRGDGEWIAKTEAGLNLTSAQCRKLNNSEFEYDEDGDYWFYTLPSDKLDRYKAEAVLAEKIKNAPAYVYFYNTRGSHNVTVAYDLNVETGLVRWGAAFGIKSDDPEKGITADEFKKDYGRMLASGRLEKEKTSVSFKLKDPNADGVHQEIVKTILGGMREYARCPKPATRFFLS